MSRSVTICLAASRPLRTTRDRAAGGSRASRPDKLQWAVAEGEQEDRLFFASDPNARYRTRPISIDEFQGIFVRRGVRSLPGIGRPRVYAVIICCRTDSSIQRKVRLMKRRSWELSVEDHVVGRPNEGRAKRLFFDLDSLEADVISPMWVGGNG